MNVIEAILTRRTIKDFAPTAVPGDLLESVLSAGLWAPNHRLTQPWRFTRLGPKTREALALAFPEAQSKLAAKPVIVAVSSVLSGDGQQRREDYAATCCAIQNIQLAAWAEGLGTMWSTSKLTRDPQTYVLLHVDPAREEIVGFLNLGFPAKGPPAPPRLPLAAVMRFEP